MLHADPSPSSMLLSDASPSKRRQFLPLLQPRSSIPAGSALHAAASTCGVGQSRIYAPYKTVYLVNPLPKTPYIHRIFLVLANPTYLAFA